MSKVRNRRRWGGGPRGGPRGTEAPASSPNASSLAFATLGRARRRARARRRGRGTRERTRCRARATRRRGVERGPRASRVSTEGGASGARACARPAKLRWRIRRSMSFTGRRRSKFDEVCRRISKSHDGLPPTHSLPPRPHVVAPRPAPHLLSATFLITRLSSIDYGRIQARRGCPRGHPPRAFSRQPSLRRLARGAGAPHALRARVVRARRGSVLPSGQAERPRASGRVLA